MLQNKNLQHIQPSTWVEVDLKAIKHNLKELRRLAERNRFSLPLREKLKKTMVHPMELLAVVKADAYGHGMERIGLLLDREGIGFFGVSDVEEGIRLRKAGIKKPILLFESTVSSQVQQISHYHLMPTVCTLELATFLNRYAQKLKRRISIHIKVDTGMGRLGIWHEEAFDFVKKINKLMYLTIQGIYTHFPVADTDRRFTQSQIEKLYRIVNRLDKKGLVVPYIHAANSMGLAGYKTHVLNLARPGLMIYGLYPSSKLKKKVKLKPALSVKSMIIFLKTIKKGRSISYGRTFIARKSMTAATIPIGYNDGYLRGLSNKACVLISGHRCPVVGRVTMDQTVVDVSGVKSVTLGMPVTILGTQMKASVSADELAKYAKTINYEIVCALGNRLPRLYI